MLEEPFIVGLTGGIGSGKSTVASLFAAFGASIVDTDAISHALTMRHGRAIKVIRQLMGEDLIAPDGSLDRRAARQLVFADNVARQQLESILHPLIREEVEAALRTPTVKRAPYTLLVVPLLFETSAYRERARQTLLIDCSVRTQLERVQNRSGLGLDEAMRIVAAQLPRAIKLQLTDDVICNDGGLESLTLQTERVHNGYMKLVTTVE
ncbi:MAG: dephospho-CoA kinase [Betaproteobacteria bacterium]